MRGLSHFINEIFIKLSLLVNFTSESLFYFSHYGFSLVKFNFKLEIQTTKKEPIGSFLFHRKLFLT